jgi:hypothetical protein
MGRTASAEKIRRLEAQQMIPAGRESDLGRRCCEPAEACEESGGGDPDIDG